MRRDGRVAPVMGTSPGRAVHRAVLRGAERVWHDLRFKDLYRTGREFELMRRALVLVEGPSAELSIYRRIGALEA